MGHWRLIPLTLALAVAPALCLAQADPAKGYPDRPIRLLVPNAPGASVDTLSRIVATKLSDVIGQQVVVDNRAGAGGIIGMEIAKAAAPDGYTMIAATTAASTIAIQLHKNKSFDPVRDYDYVVQFAETPNVLVVNPGLPIKTVKDLIDYTKARNGQVNMASAGSGAQSHLSGVYFMLSAHIQSVHVPYKGGGASVAAVIANESQWTLTPAPAVMSFVGAGRLRAIGHSLPKPAALMPNIPPIADTVPGFDYSGWQGIFLPKGTPKAINAKLRAAIEKTMALPDVKRLMAAQATEIVIRGPDEFRKVVAESMAQNGKVIKEIGLKID